MDQRVMESREWTGKVKRRVGTQRNRGSSQGVDIVRDRDGIRPIPTPTSPT